MSGAELEPLPEPVRKLPAPRELAAMLREVLESEIVRVRQERGDVHAPEDTHALIRSLQAFREAAGDYGRAFSTVAGVAGQEIEQELLSAVGEQDGVPNSGMGVPDADGTTIKVSIDSSNSYDIDADSVYPTLAELLVATHPSLVDDILNAAVSVALDIDDRPRLMAEFSGAINQALVLAMNELSTIGTVTLQVTKVKALAASLGRLGADKLASVATGAIRKTTSHKGVSIKREQPK